ADRRRRRPQARRRRARGGIQMNALKNPLPNRIEHFQARRAQGYAFEWQSTYMRRTPVDAERAARLESIGERIHEVWEGPTSRECRGQSVVHDVSPRRSRPGVAKPRRRQRLAELVAVQAEPQLREVSHEDDEVSV